MATVPSTPYPVANLSLSFNVDAASNTIAISGSVTPQGQNPVPINITVPLTGFGIQPFGEGPYGE